MQVKSKNGLKVVIIAIALLLCLALAIGITGAFYQAKRQATGTLSMDQGIIIDYKGFDKTGDEWSKWERTATLPLFSITNAQPGEQIAVNAAGIRANEKSVNFYARVKLSYKFYNGETPVEFLESTKLIKTSSSFFGTNWVESGDGYFYYAAGSTLNKFAKTATTFVDLFATDAKFIIEGAGFTGATSDGEGGGFVVGDTSINKIVVYLTLETLQGDADAAAEGWKITEVIKPVEVDVTTEEKPDINIDDIISEGKKDGEITISGNPTAMKTILIGSRAFEGCTNLRLKLNNSANITYIIASDAFSAGAKIWYGAAEATNLLINADTTGKTAGKDNAWVVAEPNLKVFLPTGVTQNSTNTSYGKYQYTDDQGTWYFNLLDSNGKTVTLSSNNNMSVSTLSASTYANTNTYTAKLNKFEPKAGVTTVVIPKFIGISQDSDKYGVTELFQTFEYCRDLTSITIPDSVSIIGWYAFSQCSNLTSIAIPASVKEIDGTAFDCKALTSLTVDSGNNVYHSEGNCIIETASKTLITGCKNSVIPTDGSVTSIGDGAFDFSSLTSIIIPDSVTSIEEGAFADGYYNLSSISIGAGIKEVSWLPANWGDSLRVITISKENPYLTTDSKAIYEKTEDGLIVSKYVSAETSYDIPSSIDGLSVTSIGSAAFKSCGKLISIAIPNSVTQIGENAFNECRKLESINIPDGVTSIGYQAFSNCTALISITIPDSVTSIGDYALINCSGLTLLHIGAGIQDTAWLPDNVKMSVSISENNQYLATDSKAIFTKSNGELSVSKYFFAETTYEIPSIVDGLSVTGIGDSAFNGLWRISSITIPNSITYIGANAFYGCSGLTSITLPNSVISIGPYAFSGCYELTSINIPDRVTSIESGVFWGCSGLTSITIPNSVTSIGSSVFQNCSGLKSVVIKGNITEIPMWCFSGCSSLESIVLPSSVETIGDGVFSGCSKLTTIYVDNADATAITGLGFKLAEDGKKYDENGIENTSGKYYKYTGAIA